MCIPASPCFPYSSSSSSFIWWQNEYSRRDATHTHTHSDLNFVLVRLPLLIHFQQRDTYRGENRCVGVLYSSWVVGPAHWLRQYIEVVPACICYTRRSGWPWRVSEREPRDPSLFSASLSSRRESHGSALCITSTYHPRCLSVYTYVFIRRAEIPQLRVPSITREREKQRQHQKQVHTCNVYVRPFTKKWEK